MDADIEFPSHIIEGANLRGYNTPSSDIMLLPNFIIITLSLFSVPRNMPLLEEDTVGGSKLHITSTSDYGARKNHPTTYDDNPPFKGPLRLEQQSSPDFHRQRIRGYYQESLLSTIDDLPAICPSTPTEKILRSIVDHLARRDAPVDVKEVAESIEFYLRCGKRLIGAARRVLKNRNRGIDGSGQTSTIAIRDLCSGHGLTGLLFIACNPPGRFPDTDLRAVLVDQFEPKSHGILRDCISDICPWVKESVSFQTMPLEEYALRTVKERISDSEDMQCEATIIISTHACGSLTDKVLSHATSIEAASIAVMPCCYTGTDSGVPYGVRRILGVGLSADVERSFYLQEHKYLVDFASVPRAITPMNRIIVAERRK